MVGYELSGPKVHFQGLWYPSVFKEILPVSKEPFFTETRENRVFL